MIRSAQRIRRKRTTKPPEERLDDLLNAARFVFLKHGVPDTSIDEITERAGVSKGTFYLYFKSKEDAVGAVWQKYIEDFRTMAEGALAKNGLDYLPRVTNIFVELAAYVLGHADLHRRVYRSIDSVEFSRSKNQELIVMIANLVRQGVEAGELAADDPDLQVRMLFHGVCGALHDSIAGKGPIDRARLINAAAQLTSATFSTQNSLLDASVGKFGPKRPVTVRSGQRKRG